MDFARMTRMFSACAALVLAVSALAASPSSASVELQGAVPTQYSYNLVWSSRKRVLSGTGAVGVENHGPGSIDRVWLRLRPNGDSRLETISQVRGATVLDARAGGSIVQLKLRDAVREGESASIRFRLRLKVGVEDTSLGRSVGVNLFGDALPVVAVAGPRGVRVGPEPSYGEGGLNPVAQWQVVLRMPRGQVPILPGTRSTAPSTDSHRAVDIASLRARDFAFAIGRFSYRSKRVDGVEIEVAAPPALKRQLPAALRRAVNAFRQMQRWYGGYNLPALRIVLGDLEFGGSEYPGIVFSTPDNATIAHEVAHQWFYGIVGNDQYNDPFLDESLTAFSEQRFHKSYRCNLARPIRGKHGLGTGMSYWQKHPAAYEDTIYRGGACALTVLQRDLGAEAFDRALRAYVAANADKIAGMNDFLDAIRTAAPWYDLARWQKLVGLN